MAGDAAGKGRASTSGQVPRLVAYERASTARQGQSCLGLEAQRRADDDDARSRGAEVLPRFTEVESGRKAGRPGLARAVHLARVTGATPVIAKLDRLSRNAALLLALRDNRKRHRIHFKAKKHVDDGAGKGS